MVSINKLVVYRRRIREQPQPAERPDTFVLAQNIAGDTLSRNAVEPIATRNKITFQPARFAIFHKRYTRFITLEIVQLDLFYAINGLGAARLSRLH